jgi:hypothetical protein
VARAAQFRRATRAPRRRRLFAPAAAEPPTAAVPFAVVRRPALRWPLRVARGRLTVPPLPAAATGGVITRVGTYGEGGSNATAASWTCTLPTGIQAGDLIVIDTVASLATPPAVNATGYTQRTVVTNGTNATTRLWKIAGSSESNPTITPDTSCGGRSIATAYRGVDQTTPWDTADTTAASSTGTATSLTLPNLTTVTDQALLVVGFSSRIPSGTINGHTPGANYTEIGESQSSGATSGANSTVSANERTAGQVAVGTYGGDTFSTVTGGRLVLLHGALRPAAGGPPAAPPLPPLVVSQYATLH